MHQQPFTTPTMMNVPPRFAMAPAAASMSSPTSQAMRMTARANDPMRRDLRLDSMLLSQLRRNAYMGPGGYGGSSSAMTPYGSLSVYGGSPGAAGGGYAPAVAPADAGQVALQRAQAAAERLADRRRAVDESAGERERIPTPEEELLSRSRGNAPRAELLSGKTLNVLLADLRRLGAGADTEGLPDLAMPLDGRALNHINATRGPGHVAVLKNAGRLNWPAALTGAAFQEPRDRLAALAPEAVRQTVRDRGVDPDTIRRMAGDVDQLHKLLRQKARDLAFEPFTEAKVFLQNFDDALVALRQPNAVDHFNGTYDLSARTVFGLVKEMTDIGLRFAPAGPGDEAAYAVLRDALAECDRAALNRPSGAR